MIVVEECKGSTPHTGYERVDVAFRAAGVWAREGTVC